MKSGAKHLVGIILATAIMTFAVADGIQGFLSNDGFHYFSEQPHRLLLVAGIGVVGGFVAFGYSALPRVVKLVILGLGASFVMLAGGYFSFKIVSLQAQLAPATPWLIPWVVVLSTLAIAGFLWFEFYQVFKRRDRGVS